MNTKVLFSKFHARGLLELVHHLAITLSQHIYSSALLPVALNTLHPRFARFVAQNGLKRTHRRKLIQRKVDTCKHKRAGSNQFVRGRPRCTGTHTHTHTNTHTPHEHMHAHHETSCT